MGDPIILTMDGELAFTFTGIGGLASLAGYQCTLISNSASEPAAIVSVGVTSGSSAPTANLCYRVHLLRDTGTLVNDGASANYGSITILNAPVLGDILVTSNANTAFTGIFDTGPLGPLGPTWGIAIVNMTDQSIHATSAYSGGFYNYYVPEIDN